VFFFVSSDVREAALERHRPADRAMPAPPPPGRGAAAATPEAPCRLGGAVAFGSPRARRARVATTARSKENKARLLGRSVVGFLKANTAALLFSLVVFSCALAAAAEAVPATSAPRRLLSAATFPAKSSTRVANAFDPATDPRAVETKSETKSAYAISGDVGDSRDSRVAAAARPRRADDGERSARAAIFPSRATVRGGAFGIGRERDPLVRPSPLSNGGGSSASRPASASRPTTPDEAAGGVAYDDANVPPTWGVSSLEAVRRDAEWCPPGATDFAKCDPAPNQIPTPRVPAFDAVNGAPGAKSAHGASSQTSSHIQSRADWENDLEMRPFRLRWQQPVRAVPQVTHAVDVAKTDPTSGVVSTRKQTFEWYEMRQMLSFASLFPARTCAADDTVCRPCETAAAGSNPLAEGLPKADDETADCATVGGKNLRCLKAGEVPFWWYNGVGPGPLIRVPDGPEVAERAREAERGGPEIHRAQPDRAPKERPALELRRRRDDARRLGVQERHHLHAPPRVVRPARLRRLGGRRHRVGAAQGLLLRQRHGSSNQLVPRPRHTQHWVQRRERFVRDVPHLRPAAVRGRARTANGFCRAGSTRDATSSPRAPETLATRTKKATVSSCP
jgi:hypothetical protein